MPHPKVIIIFSITLLISVSFTYIFGHILLGKRSTPETNKQKRTINESKTSRPITALYRGYTSHNNLGDDLLEEIIQSLLSQAFTRRGYAFSMVTYRQDCEAPWSHNHFDFLILGGGSLLNMQWICMPILNMFTNKTVFVAGSGYDDYKEILRNKNLYENFIQGDLSSLFLVDKDVMNRIYFLIRHRHLYGGFRGNYTMSIVQKVAGLKPSQLLPIIGDFAHVARQIYGIDSKTPFYQEMAFQPEQKYIVVNVAKRWKVSYEGQEGLVRSSLLDALFKLSEKYSILVYAMAKTDISYVNTFCKILRTKLIHQKGGMNNTIKCLNDIPDVPGIGMLIKNAEFTINYLLHSNYLSAAYETPFIPLIYRLKVLDLVASMDWWEFSVHMHSIKSKDILQAVENVVKNRESLVERIKAQNEKVRIKVERAIDEVVNSVIG